ncbi:NDR1/HIN1-like protein 6 isoform X1 [Panicum virgatum]|uniref:NDR1/HIN1-like protein 6 isoform X1 n=1 Tax=Panicum virgatum TaxID=38727 RepID=UPI0019D65410|nr:NDR1/HIN1-like protein 6 isoform X1 [Panicum virgatum]
MHLQKQLPPRRGEAPAPAAVPPGHYAAAGQPFFRPPPPSDPPGAGHNRAPPPERPSPRPPYAERPLPRSSSDHPAPTAPGRGPPQHAYPAAAEHPLRRPTRKRSSSALASCLAATAFLVLSAGGAGAALFLLFRPRPPDIAVAAVRLPSFAAANGTVAFTFQQTASVRNPNRSPLAHFHSSLRVAYAGGELGSVYIPAGLIDGGRTKDMSATFDVPAIPVAQQQQQQQPQPVAIEVESLLVVNGRVKMLRLLTHRVQAAKVCRVALSPLDGRVLGFRC